MDTMNVAISPKFFKKLIWISSLSQLSNHIPLSRIKIPAEVSLEISKREPQFVKPFSPKVKENGIFCVPLEHLFARIGGIPVVITDSIEDIRKRGLDEVGIFRRSPNMRIFREIKDSFDNGDSVDLSTSDIHVSATLLKVFCRRLPTPIFPESLYQEFEPMRRIRSDNERNDFIRNEILSKIPSPEKMILAEIFHLLHEVSLHSNVNLMTSNNLAIVWAPNLVESGNPLVDLSMSSVDNPAGVGIIVKSMIENPQFFFQDQMVSPSPVVQELSTFAPNDEASFHTPPATLTVDTSARDVESDGVLDDPFLSDDDAELIRPSVKDLTKKFSQQQISEQ